MVVLPPVMEPAEFNQNYVLYWNQVGLELNRLTHTVGGPQTGPTLSSRALGILHVAINDAYFAILPDPQGFSTTYLSEVHQFLEQRVPSKPNSADARSAVAAAAITVLRQLYTRTPGNFSASAIERLRKELQASVDAFPDLFALSPGYQFGEAIGEAILRLLDIRPDEPGADQGFYRPREGRYRFSDEPTNPVRLVPVDPNMPNGPQQAVQIYNAPFYGSTAKRFAVQMTTNGLANGPPTEHIIADPPVGFGRTNEKEYEDSFREVFLLGGAFGLNTTKRTPDQSVAAYYWANDGSNLIGTPVRFLNQIVRRVAWDRMPGGPTSEETNADFVRLFALVNASMADAGIFSWREKYNFEFWRPLSGVRNDGGPMADPFWLSLGAPDTNSDRINFKPPFPAYPSGHATFGGAALQIMRLYYRRRDNLDFGPDEPDNIGFELVSEELNGVNRDLRQPYDPARPITDQVGTVRTLVRRRFRSLWEAMFENGISRIWLGVHWHFDAFAAADTTVPLRRDGEGEGDGNEGQHQYQHPLYPGTHHDVVRYKDPADIRYNTLQPRGDRPGQLFPVGGVPLGIGIANDVFGGNLQPTPAQLQPATVRSRGMGISGGSNGRAGAGAGSVGGSGSGGDGSGGSSVSFETTGFGP